MEQHVEKSPARDGQPVAIVIAALWVFATVLNIIKPFHMDDTAHLIIAAHIVDAPLSPMSGMLNWTNTAEPIFYTNQPHLMFYAFAGLIAMFGPSPLALHLFISLFTLAALVLIFRVAHRVAPENALWLTAAIGLSPGFVINQNVMVDMPLLAMMLLAVWAIIAMPCRPVVAFWALSAALLTKYTSLFMLPVLAAAAAFRGRALLWLVLPVLALLGWSLFNIADFGQAHILNRPTSSERGFMPSELLTIGLWGALSAFALPLYALLVVATRSVLWAALGPVGAICWIVVWSYARPDVQMGWLIVNAVFIGAALSVCLAALVGFAQITLSGMRQLASRGFARWASENHALITIALWTAGGVLFLITFAPFMATRHAMLVIVPITLLAMAGRPVARVANPAIWGSLAVSAVLSIVLVLNDRSFANFYATHAETARDLAAELAGQDGRIETTGHWGWQYYAMKAGIPVYDTVRSNIGPSDILIHTPYVDHQSLPDLGEFSEKAALTHPSGFATTFDTRLLYAAGARALPFLAPGPDHRIVFLQRRGEDG